MVDNVSSIFDRKGAGAASLPPATSTVEPAVEKEPYGIKHFSKSERGTRVYVIESNGNHRVIPYMDIGETISVAPDRVGFEYRNGVIFMQGDNMRAVLRLIQEERIKDLEPFNEALHLQPDDAKAPVIYNIEYQTREQVMNTGR